MRDDQAFNIRFVSLVEVRPCLYDNTREDYNLSHVQERAWAEIAEQMNASVADCKGRWKNLRGSYTKHLKKCKTSGSQASTLRPYYLAKHMQFIHPFTKSRSSKGNIVPPTYEQLPSHLNEDYAGFGTQTIDEKDGWGVMDPTDDEDQGNSTETYQNSPQNLVETVYVEDEPIAKFEKKRKVDSSSVQFSEQRLKERKTDQSNFTLEAGANKSALECFENQNEIKKTQPDGALTADHDADVHFLFSLLPDLKKMTDRQKRRFKVEILNLAGQILEET